jgi:hypothetical protein
LLVGLVMLLVALPFLFPPLEQAIEHALTLIGR